MKKCKKTPQTLCATDYYCSTKIVPKKNKTHIVNKQRINYMIFRVFNMRNNKNSEKGENKNLINKKMVA